MSRRTEKKIEKIEHDVVVVICDLCGKEAPPSEIYISENSFQAPADAISPTWWWSNPLNRIVGLSKHGTKPVKNNSDFDVHVKCGYEAIEDAVKRSKR